MSRRSPSLLDKSELSPAQFKRLLASISARVSTGTAPYPIPYPTEPEPEPARDYDLCAGGVNPGFDECEKCGATMDDPCPYDRQGSQP